MQHFGNFSVAKSSCRKLRNFTLPFAERLLPFILLLGNERLPFRHSRDILYRQATDFLNDSGIFSGNRGQIKQRLQIFAEISRKRKHLIPFCQGKRKFQMLRRLSGRRHTVVSGVTLRTAGRMHTFSAESGVWFRPLSEEEIGYYLDTFAPYDKAGSYGIQEWIGYAAIEKINGSFYNVMGLPIQKVYVELEKFLQ